MSIQKKMFLCIIIFLILPLILLGFLYYDILLDTTKENLDRSSYELLEQMERNVQVKTGRLKAKTDVLVFDRQFQQLLRDTDFSLHNTATYDAFSMMDDVMEQYFYDEKELESIIILTNDGDVYTYRGSKKEENLVSFIAKYGKVETVPGDLSWFGISGDENSISSTLAAGVKIADTGYKIDQQELATIYFIYGNTFFDNINIQTVNQNELFMICTADGTRIYACGSERVPQLWEISIVAGQKIHRQQQGSMQLMINGEKCILVFYTSPGFGWKYVRIVKYTEYFAEAETMKLLTILVVVVLFLVLCVANALWLRHLTKPVRKIVDGMQEVGKRNFDVELSVVSKDEFGIIAHGFNSMVKEIRKLFNQVIEEERKSKEAELSALQYQINPHFLYNTLSAIRLTSIFNNQYEVADMLSLLGTFLHNTLSHINKKITLEDELKNIRDYISLYQIRFNNQIEVDFDVDEELEKCFIHTMLIQPVVENAIMHGLNKKLGGGEKAIVRIVAEKNKNFLLVRVWDNGSGMTEEQCLKVLQDNTKEQNGLHIGLSNIYKRIRYLYGVQYGISVISELDSFTEVELTLPLNMPEN